MEVVYCDNCGFKINPDDFHARVAVRGDDGKLYCGKCAPLYEQTSSALLKVVLPVASAPIDNRVDDRATAVGLPATMSPEKPMTKFFFCETCGKRITDTDIEKGAGRDKKLKGVYCKDCAQGVSTMEFEALKAPPAEPAAPLANPAAHAPARPPSPAPMASVDHARNKPAVAASRKDSGASIIPWVAGALALSLALYMFFGRSHNVPTAPEKIAKNETLPSQPPSLPAQPPPPPPVPPPAPSNPSGSLPVAGEKNTNPPASNEPLTTLRVDFPKEGPPGGEGFETGDNPPAGSIGHPRHLTLRPKSGPGSTAGVDVSKFFAATSGQKAKVFVKATATSVLRMHIYADNVTHLGAGVLEGGSSVWHGFGCRNSFSKQQHAWIWVEIPLKELKDEKGQFVKPGLQIQSFSVSAFGARPGFELWIDELALLPAPADEKP